MHNKEILSRINSIVSSMSRISRNEHAALNVLEADLLKKYCLDMYDLLLQLNQSAEPIGETETVQLAEVEAAPDLFPMEMENTFSEPATDESFIGFATEPIMEAEPEEPLQSLWSTPEYIPEPEPEPEPEVIPETPVAEVKTEKAPEAEPLPDKVPDAQPELSLSLHSRLMEEEELTLNDKISQTLEKKALVESMMHTPIDDIKTHIALNKKVAFIIGLFNEESEAYNNAVEYLNTAPDLNTALDYYHSCKRKYGWNPGSELAADLEALVRRRHNNA